MIVTVIKALRGWSCLIALAIIVFLINIGQMCSLILLPVNRRLFTRINMLAKHTFSAAVVKLSMFCGNRLIVTGDPPPRENILAFANHQSMIDIIYLWTWSSKPGTMGWIKWFVKDVLKYVPGLGWGLLFVNTLFVKRNWAKDADSIRATFAKLRQANLPLWLLIFPEGTRMKPAKFAASRNYAERKGLPVFDHVLLPRGKGIHSSLQGLSGLLTGIYDITIQYDGPIPGIVGFFTKGGLTGRLHAVRFNVSDVPERERDLNAWLLERFVVKDKLLAKGLGSLNPEK